MLRMGIDLGGTKTEGIVMDAAGNILVRERRPTPRADGYDAIVANIHSLVLDLEKQAGQSCRVGIGTPGAISAGTGYLKNSNTVCMNGRPVKADLEKVLSREIRIANDANCFALSEALDGAGRGQGVVFGVILGTGVGGGLVFHGRLHQGPQHIAGEWGHNVLEPDGPPCYCGRRGCVETFLSGPGLARDYRMSGAAHDSRDGGGRTASGTAAEGRASVAEGWMPGATGDPALDAQAIVAAAGRGDALAEAAVQRYLDRFGRALAVVINILDPDAVVLGGGMSNIARLYTEGRERVARYIFAAHGCANVTEDTTPGMEEVEPCREQRPRMSGAANDVPRTNLLPNAHGDSSGVRGAAQLWRPEE
ncbi:MAG: ROK family protein [Gammaproteobacteria bacterium]|nr:ROK family protein [Gammaproteobacteria bacterium]